MKWSALLTTLCLTSTPAPACDLALLLAVDVSGSVDRDEFDIQMVGLAEALREATIADALVAQRAMLALVQWTGSSRQRQTIGWTQMTTRADVERFADRVADDRRIWRNYSTAVGEALTASAAAMTEVEHCRRRVIDVSGDGVSNEGIEPQLQRPMLTRLDITVNALAIETNETDLTAYFFENVIHGPGAFVFTADGFEDYPRQIERKLQREVLDRIGAVAEE